MRIAVVGAGPAGLFFSLLMKRRRPKGEIVVIDQNPRDATFGFGVVFSRGALEFLRRRRVVTRIRSGGSRPTRPRRSGERLP